MTKIDEAYRNLGNAIVLQAHEDSVDILKKLFLEEKCTKSMVKDWADIMRFVQGNWYRELCDVLPQDFTDALFTDVNLPKEKGILLHYTLNLMNMFCCSAVKSAGKEMNER